MPIKDKIMNHELTEFHDIQDKASIMEQLEKKTTLFSRQGLVFEKINLEEESA